MCDRHSFSGHIYRSLPTCARAIVMVCVVALALPIISHSALEFDEGTSGDETTFQVDTPHESWSASIFQNSYALIASDAELAIMDTLPEESLTRFLSIFWKMRDPTPTTQENEYKTQFEERIEVALARYSASGGKVPWDARGEVYIRFGPPDELQNSVDQWYAPLDTIRINRGMPDPNMGKEFYGEKWHYFGRNLILQFQGYNASYEHVPFVLTNGEYQELMHYHEDKKEIETTHVAYVAPGEIVLKPLAIECYPFRRDDGNYDVYISSGIKLKSVSRRVNHGKREISYKARAAVFNDALVQVWIDSLIQAGTVESKRRNELAYNQWQLVLPPGQYVFTVELISNKGKMRAVATYDRWLVPYADTVALDLSPLVIAANVDSEDNQNSGFFRNGKSIVCMPGRVFNKKQNVFFYHEVYGLLKGPDGNTRYRIEYTLYNEAGDTQTVLASRTLESSRTDTYQTGAIPHAILTKGEYILGVSTTDLIADVTKTALASFKVK